MPANIKKHYRKILSNKKRAISFHLIALFLVGIPGLYYTAQIRPGIGNTSYYVDCQNGNDSNTGTSRFSPWKTLLKANTALLKPGDKLLFKKGTVCDGQLAANWNGTEESPIVIGAYNTGNKPIIQYNANYTDNNHVVIDINGSYQVIEGLHTRVLNHYKDELAQCTTAGNEYVKAGWYIGYAISGHHNTIQNSEASQLAAGIFTKDESSYNKILHNYIHDLNTFWDTDHNIQPGTSLGAVGINLHGNDNEYAYNFFENNHVECAKADGTNVSYGAPFELYNANRATVRHNIAYGHRKHFEMGHDSTHTANDNIFAYNLLVSERPEAKGPNIHGAANPFGPVNNTKIYNNTIYFTGPNSEALVTAGPGTLVKNNILVADGKINNGTNTKVVAFYNGDYTENNNIYWRIGGTPKVQKCYQGECQQDALIDPSSKKVDPLFVDIPNKDFKLQDTSPAIDSGANLGMYSSDLNNLVVPWAGGPDMGAYEYGSEPVSTGIRDIFIQAFQ